MWLINVKTLELEEFFDEKAPPYAILSHTWGTGVEVTFQEMRKSVDGSPESIRLRQKEGFEKIKKCCIQAARDGLDYAWVDTCCMHDCLIHPETCRIY